LSECVFPLCEQQLQPAKSPQCLTIAAVVLPEEFFQTLKLVMKVARSQGPLPLWTRCVKHGVLKDRHTPNRGCDTVVRFTVYRFHFWGCASCCARFIKIIRKTVFRNNCLICLLYLYFERYMFGLYRPSSRGTHNM
jgi:hypothetical protein